MDKAIAQEIEGDGLAANAKGIDSLAKLKADMPDSED
jgi:hypothetical protein